MNTGLFTSMHMRSLKFVVVALLILATALYFFLHRENIDFRQTVFIPKGDFIFGSDDMDMFSSEKDDFGINDGIFLENERPVRKLFLKSFYIDKYEVTNQAYKKFTNDTSTPTPPTWKWGNYDKGTDFFPVRDVSWYDAEKYCRWEGKRLPKEAEWEKAARGPNGNRYPWGNEFSKEKANFDKREKVPVGSVKGDTSFYGVSDMAGNVMEFTDSWYEPYPGSKKKSMTYGKLYRVIRGWFGAHTAHYHRPYVNARASARHYFIPEAVGENMGFRCAKDGQGK